MNRGIENGAGTGAARLAEVAKRVTTNVIHGAAVDFAQGLGEEASRAWVERTPRQREHPPRYPGVLRQSWRDLVAHPVTKDLVTQTGGVLIRVATRAVTNRIRNRTQ